MKVSKKVLIIAIAVILVILSTIVALVSAPRDDGDISVSETKSSEAAPSKPIFMYFVTNSDLENGDTKNALEKLQKKYSEKVIFEIKNVDEDKELLENFSIVKGNTPALIMLDTSNDISSVLYKTSSYDTLKDAVKKAVNK